MEKSFRQLLGMSQELFAFYLNVSKSLISLVELRLRSLPGKASNKEVNLFIRWLAFEKDWIPKEPTPIPESEKEDAVKVLGRKLKKLKYLKDKREIDADYGPFKPDYAKANAFLADVLKDVSDPADKNLLELAILKNEIKMRPKPLSESILENIRIRLQEIEIEEIEKALKDLEK